MWFIRFVVKFIRFVRLKERSNFRQGEIFEQKIDFGNGIYTYAKEW